MKTIVVYKSRTGFTQKYAEWIAEELSADIYKRDEVDLDTIVEYDTIIYGGGLYAAGIGGIKLIIKNLDKLAGKKIAVFATGASPPREKDINEIKKTNFTEEQLKELTFFYLRGGFNYDKLSPLFKIVMSLFKYRLKKLKKTDPDARGMLASYENPTDFTRKKNIDKLVEYIRQK